MVKRLFVLALLLSACNDPPKLEPDEEIAVQAAEEAFIQLGHDPQDYLSDFIVQWAKTDKEFAQLCGIPPRYAAACATQYVNAGGRAFPRAVLRPNQPLFDPDGCSVVSHETIHWLILYFNLAPDTPWGMGLHTDRRFFGRSYKGSAENRACVWLREHRPLLPDLVLSL